MPLDADVVRLAQGKNLATVVTLMPDGQPQALLTVARHAATAGPRHGQPRQHPTIDSGGPPLEDHL
jgi:hypothetical protein